MRWAVEATITALSVILSVVAVWIIASHWKAQGRELSVRTNVIASPDDLQWFISDRSEAGLAANFSNGPPVQVPTGVFIQSLVFSSTSDVNLTGILWQKYPENYVYDRGVTFPEQIGSGSTVLDPIYASKTSHEGKSFGSYVPVAMISFLKPA